MTGSKSIFEEERKGKREKEGKHDRMEIREYLKTGKDATTRDVIPGVTNGGQT